MRHIEISERRLLFNRVVKADIPEIYREMSAKQFHLICKLNRKQIRDEDFIVQFCSLDSRLWNKLDLFYVYKLADLVGAMKDSNHVDFFFDHCVRLGSADYYLPLFSSISLFQFMAVDTFAQWYEHTKKQTFLVNFFACLALPFNADFFSYDQVAASNVISSVVEKDPDSVSQIEDLVINWQLIKAWLTDKYPHMFPVDSAEPPADGKSPAPADWSQFFDSLIGEHLENIEPYKRLPAVDVFRIVNGRIRDRRFRK